MPIANIVSPIPIFSQMWPKDCPKAIALQLDFQTNDEYSLNLMEQITQGKIEGIQACYYDNRANNQFVDLVCSDTGQAMRFRPGWQGYRPLLWPEFPTQIMALSIGSGNGIFSLILTNTPIQPLEWDAT